jgi:hypothetical protein
MVCPVCIATTLVTNAPVIAATISGIAAMKLASVPKKRKEALLPDQDQEKQNKQKKTRPDYH